MTIPSGLSTQRLGCADLVSAFHRVPELVRATEHAADSASAAKWRCYECRICHTEVVYACTGGRDSAAPSSAAGQEEILTEGILVNLELLVLLSLLSLARASWGLLSCAFHV
jgi:hypothetical protein